MRSIQLKTTGILALLLTSGFAIEAHSVSSVHPTGVNVRTNGPTTVFLTFQGVSEQTADEAFWCGDITVAANQVVNFDPCVPGTFFGRLPTRFDRSRFSGSISSQPTDTPTDSGVPSPQTTASGSNLTDVMTIPASVARRAYQAAKNGSPSSFFYIRKFSGNGPDQYIAVTCRLAGGGARVPLALLHVTPYFETASGRQPVHLIAQNGKPPKVGATLYYNGSGRLKGRWEIVQPGDPLPSELDLLPEASLPQEERSRQQRYTVLQRFDVFMPATGRIDLPGPSPSKIPLQVIGPYQILLRIEATRDKEGDSDTGDGIVHSGGLAGFSMPPLRYYVADETAVSAALGTTPSSATLNLISPSSSRLVDASSALEFTWQETSGATLYQIELRDDEGTQWRAYVKPGTGFYQSPPWWQSEPDRRYRWRVIALDNNRDSLAKSTWRELMTK